MPRTLTIIGAGHLGQTLGHLWAVGGALRIQDILNRTLASTEAAIAFIGTGCPASRITQLPHADIYLIATPDDQIAGSCAALAASGNLSATSIVFHCSGALTSSVLDAASRAGAAVASVHPIRSFAQPRQAVANFAGTRCGVEGDLAALEVLSDCFTAIGAQFVPIKAEQKVLYHAAAVFACNYLVTLQDVALAMYAEAGIAPDVALTMMEPMVRATIDNIFNHGPAKALSGPIARGDTVTVEKHQEALAKLDPAYSELYRLFAELTTRLAGRTP